jgi:hypothetical protein
MNNEREILSLFSWSADNNPRLASQHWNQKVQTDEARLHVDQKKRSLATLVIMDSPKSNNWRAKKKVKVEANLS